MTWSTVDIGFLNTENSNRYNITTISDFSCMVGSKNCLILGTVNLIVKCDDQDQMQDFS